MKARTVLTILLLIWLVSGELCGRDASLADLRYRRPVNTSDLPSNKADIYYVELDKEVFEHTETTLNDLRLFEGGNAARFRIQHAYTDKRGACEVSVKAQILTLRRSEANQLELVVKCERNYEQGFAPAKLKFVTSNRNFEKRVSVYGSNDRSAWQCLAENQPIFDYSAIIPFSNATVRIKSGDYLFYKVVIDNFAEDRVSPTLEIVKEQRKGADFSKIEKMIKTQQHLKIDSVLFIDKQAVTVRRELKTQPYQLTDFKVSQLKDGKTQITVKSSRQPITTFALETDDENFIRDCRVFASDDESKWRPIGGGQIIKIKGDVYGKNNLALTISESRFPFYRIVIANQDAPPVTIGKVTAKGNVYKVEFLAPANPESVYLYYGGEKISAPVYDIDSIISRMKHPVSYQLSLGPQEENPDFDDSVRMPSFDSRIVFYVVIGLMVIILGFALFKSIGKIDAIEDKEDE